MKFSALVCALLAVSGAHLGAQEKPAPASATTAPTVATPAATASTPATTAAAPAAAPKLPPDMTVYYFCLLTRGPNAGKGTKEELAAGQAAHMANIQRLAASGKLLVAGPIADRGDWRGIFIFKCASLEEAKELVASDPLIKDQRLIADVRPWLTMKGNLRDPEFPTPPASQTP